MLDDLPEHPSRRVEGFAAFRALCQGCLPLPSLLSLHALSTSPHPPGVQRMASTSKMSRDPSLCLNALWLSLSVHLSVYLSCPVLSVCLSVGLYLSLSWHLSHKSRQDLAQMSRQDLKNVLCNAVVDLLDTSQKVRSETPKCYSQYFAILSFYTCLTLKSGTDLRQDLAIASQKQCCDSTCRLQALIISFFLSLTCVYASLSLYLNPPSLFLCLPFSFAVFEGIHYKLRWQFCLQKSKSAGTYTSERC